VSPNHRWIAFEALRDGPAGPPSLGLLDTETHEIQWLEEGRGCSFPAWSPDSSMIAASCDLNIRVIDLGTRDSVLFADCATEDNACTDPNWSPDGATMLVYRAMEFHPDPGVYSLSTACLEPPASCSAEPEFFLRGTPPFAWSPAGDLIAFVTFDGALGYADPEGRILQTLAIPDRSQVVSMAWSEEGDVLALTLASSSNGLGSYLLTIGEGGEALQANIYPNQRTIFPGWLRLIFDYH